MLLFYFLALYFDFAVQSYAVLKLWTNAPDNNKFGNPSIEMHFKTVPTFSAFPTLSFVTDCKSIIYVAQNAGIMPGAPHLPSHQISESPAMSCWLADFIKFFS